MNFILNLSPKKTGTSTVYNLFRKNFPAFSQKELFIPPVKEYYTFRRNTKLFFSLDSTIKELFNEEAHKLCDTDKRFFDNIETTAIMSNANSINLKGV